MATVMFDKIIDVEFISDVVSPETNNQFSMSTGIITPEKGRKPQIEISGQLTGRTQIMTIFLKITNFYSSQDLSSLKSVKIKAGYKGSSQLAFSGTIINAYVETPPPDSVTVFELNVGNVEELYTKWFNKTYPEKSSVTTILNDLCTLLNLKLVSNFDDIIFFSPVSFGMTANAALSKLKIMCPDFMIRPELDQLYVIDVKKGSSIIKEIDFITMAKKEAGGFTINAPWLPTLRPGDVVRLNPQYYKQDYGGANITGKDFKIATIDFSFATCTSVNEMVLRCTI
jgi:hypothetical protein